MRFYRAFFSASNQITDPLTRKRAEMLSGLLLARQALVLAMLALTLLNFPNYTPALTLVMVNLGNLVGYALSRTRFFRLGAYLVMIEPMFGIPQFMISHPESIVGQIGNPINLGLAPVISSMALSIKETVLIVTLTAVTFAVLFIHCQPGYESTLAMVAFGVCAMCGFALLSGFVNERDQKALALERSKVLQSSKLASVGEMAAGIAHELNSPLAAILLNAETAKDMLQDTTLPSIEKEKDVSDLLNDVSAVAERMSSIIHGLKAFGRDSQHEPLVRVKVRAIVDDALHLCGQQFKSAGIALRLDAKSLETELVVRRVQMTQTMLNLLTNAFDAIQSQSEKWITIEARVSEDSVSIAVTDSGSGITGENVQRIFEPFFTTKDYGQGTGLGLSISKGIAQEHGGDLTYNPASAKTQFILRLPLSQIERRAA